MQKKKPKISQIARKYFQKAQNRERIPHNGHESHKKLPGTIHELERIVKMTRQTTRKTSLKIQNRERIPQNPQENA